MSMPRFNTGDRFGIFEYIGPSIFLKRSELRSRGSFLCKCGRQSDLSFFGVTSNPSKECLKCNYVRLNPGDIFGHLTYFGGSIDVSRSTKVEFQCSCGINKFIVLSSVIRNKSISCGRCTEVSIKYGQKFHDLVYCGVDQVTTLKNHMKGDFICVCGSKRKLEFSSVFAGRLNCGECHYIHLRYGVDYKGFIYVGDPILVGPSSTTILPFKCKCGQIRDIQVHSLTNNKIKNCGACYQKSHKWFVDNKLSIIESSSAEDLPDGGPKIIGEYTNSSTPFLAICPSCLNTYGPRLRDIKRGVSITCGCGNNKQSRLNLEVFDFVSSLGIPSEKEFLLCGKKYDLCIPSYNLIIEISGLHWHSFPDSKKKDLLKYEIAKNNGFTFLCIFEDEWNKKRLIMEDILIQKFKIRNYEKALRPSHCDIRFVSSSEADSFYEKHHYIGKCKSNVNIGAFYGGRLIASVSFKPPTRQTSRHQYELVRMASDRIYHIHGIWSKFLNIFINQYRPASLVSFSDNRLFSGSVYQKIGFSLDGETRPDYYWTKHRNRYHKSSLRKTEEERSSGLTEFEIRTSQGLRQIWDLGKKRWVLCP